MLKVRSPIGLPVPSLAVRSGGAMQVDLLAEIAARIAGDAVNSAGAVVIETAARIAADNAEAALRIAGDNDILDLITDGVLFQDVWNANTNSPAIPAAAPGNKGYYYLVTVAGSHTLDGISTWLVGDHVISNGTVWRRFIPESLIIYDSLDLVAAVGVRAGLPEVAVARGDATGSVLSSPALLEEVFSGTPKIKVTDLNGRVFAYKGKAVNLELCGAVEGNSTKDHAAFVKAFAHLDDHGGGVVLMGPRAYQTEDKLTLTTGNRKIVGHSRWISQINKMHNNTGVQIGTDTARNVSGDALDYTTGYELKDVGITIGVALSAVHSAIVVHNAKDIDLDGIYTSNIPKSLVLGQALQLPGDSSIVQNDAARLRLRRFNFDGTSNVTYGDDFIQIFSAGSISIDDGKFNGNKLVGKRAINCVQTYADTDWLHIGGRIVSEDNAGFLEVQNAGVANLTIADGLVADSCREFFMYYHSLSNVLTNIFVGRVNAEDSDAINGDTASYGVRIEPGASSSLERVHIGGFYRRFTANAVKVRKCHNITIDVHAQDTGILTTNTYPAVDVDTSEDVFIDAIADRTGVASNVHKYAVQIGSSTPRYVIGKVSSEGHGTSRLAPFSLGPGQIVLDGSQDPRFEARASAVANVTGDNTVYTVIFDAEDLDFGGNYNNATGIFTAPISGFYQFNSNITLGGVLTGHTIFNIFLVTTARTFQRNYGDQAPDANGQTAMGLSQSCSLAAGATAKIQVMVDGSTKVVDITTACSFSGALLKRAD